MTITEKAEIYEADTLLLDWSTNNFESALTFAQINPKQEVQLDIDGEIRTAKLYYFTCGDRYKVAAIYEVIE